MLKYYAPEPISKPNQAGIDVGQSYTPTTLVFTKHRTPLVGYWALPSFAISSFFVFYFYFSFLFCFIFPQNLKNIQS
jgi:hypothetical protein